MTLDKCYPVNNQVVAVIAAGVSMFALQKYNEKANKQWLREWGLTICMLAGMIVATITGHLGFLSI